MSTMTVVSCTIIICFCASVYLRIVTTSKHSSYTPRSARFSSREKQKLDGDPAMTDLFARVFWFIQISDIHVSEYRDLDRAPDLKSFIIDDAALLKPDVILVSGDLTDGSHSNQLKSEWNNYRKIITDTNVLNWTVWLDVRGNHDTLNVPNGNATQNYYKSHGVQAKLDQRGYIYTLNKSFGRYSFVCIDLSPRTGMKFPLNYFSDVTPEIAVRMNYLADCASGSNQTFWFGHYPTSTVTPSNGDFRGVLGKSAFAYLSGHLHGLYGLVPQMYAVQPQGFLELELGDWRDKRLFRIVAVDHDLVTFADYKYPGARRRGQTEWPLVLVTNPKDATFLLPLKEPVQRIASSTHIRILAWSPWPITTVSVEVDGVLLGLAKPALTDTGLGDRQQLIPLYVLPWQPSNYATGQQTHWITVTVEDSHSNRRVVKQPFIVDGHPHWEFPVLADFILHNNITQTLKMLYYFMWALIVSWLILPRIIPYSVRSHGMCNSAVSRGWCRLGTSTDLQVFILLYMVYSMTCPLYMGFLLTDHFGFVFSFGVYVAGTFITESLTYLHESIQLSIFALTVLPGLTLHLGRSIRRSRKQHTGRQSSDTDCTSDLLTNISLRPNSVSAESSTRRVFRYFCKLPMILCLSGCLFTISEVIFVTLLVAVPYGWVAGLLSPGRLGLIPFTWFLLSRCSHHKA